MFYQNPESTTQPPLTKLIVYGNSAMGPLFSSFKRKGRFESVIGPREERDMIETVTPAPRVPNPNPSDQALGGEDA